MRHYFSQELGRVRFSYLLSNEFSWHSFMHAGRRHETPGPQTKDSMTHSKRGRQRISILLCWFPKPWFPQGNTKRARWHVHTQWTAFQDAALREPRTFRIGSSMFAPEGDIRFILHSRPACSCFRERYIYLAKLFARQTSWKKKSRTKAVLVSAGRTCSNVNGSWRLDAQLVKYL